MSKAQSLVQNILDQLVSDGTERGLQIAAYHQGKLLVNAFAGVADHATGNKVTEDTLFPVFSTTKGMAATVVLRLVERGLLALDEPLAKYWPEFAAEGKGNITLRQALNHTAGLPHMPAGIGYREMCDWDGICARLAAMKPLWEPGTRMEYHAITYSWTIGEIACRVAGQTFSELIQREICEPLGITSMFVGLPEELDSKVAILEEYGPDPVAPSDGQTQSVPYWIGPLHSMMNRADARRACIPASNGIMNALAIAQHYAALLPEGFEGKKLLSAATIEKMTTPQKPDAPVDDDYQKNRGLGYVLGEPGHLYGETSKAFGHDGYGGTTGFADPVSGLAVGFTKNFYNEQGTAKVVVDALRAAL